MLCDRYAPLVSAFAEPPYLLTEIGKHLARLKAAIPFRIPPDSKIRPQDRKVVLARDELNVRAGEAVVELFGILLRMPVMFVAAPEEICSRFGFGLGAFDDALAVSASAPGASGRRDHEGDGPDGRSD